MGADSAGHTEIKKAPNRIISEIVMSEIGALLCGSTREAALGSLNFNVPGVCGDP
jgi:hypothetical protein